MFLHSRVDCQRHASLATTSSEGTRTADDSGCDLEFEGIAPAVMRLQQQLEEVEGLVDRDMTDDSSNKEEGEEERVHVFKVARYPVFSRSTNLESKLIVFFVLLKF